MQEFRKTFYLLYSVKLSVPPISIYIPSDAQLSPPLFGIFKSVFWYGKFDFILVLSLRSVYQIKRRAMLRAIDSLKRSSCAGQFSTRAILSHTMTWNRQVVVECVWQNYRLSKESARSESSVIVLNYYLPISSHSMWKDRASWKLSGARASFQCRDRA